MFPSETGSLSSLSSSDTEGDLCHQFQALGAPFTNLAQIYVPDSESDSDSDSDRELDMPPYESWV